VIATLHPPLSPEEQEALLASARVLQQAASELGFWERARA